MNSVSLIRFVAKIQVSDEGCWIWQGKLHGGYGRHSVDGRTEQAHRASYQHFIGSIPDGYELDHFKCQRKSCVHPWHVEPVSIKGRINSVRYQALKTRCKYGHEFTFENTYVDHKGARSCRTCRREAEKRWQRANPQRHMEQQLRAHEKAKEKRRSG